jgi:hypothetical protein
MQPHGLQEQKGLRTAHLAGAERGADGLEESHDLVVGVALDDGGAGGWFFRIRSSVAVSGIVS